jgi:ATP-dependent DNA ligase
VAHDWTDRFPTTAAEAKSFGTTMILDGEAVVFDEEGRSDFGSLQRALGGRGGKRQYPRQSSAHLTCCILTATIWRGWT